MVECAILAIGEELLEGSITDTNSAFIAKTLSMSDFSPRLITVLPDDPTPMTEQIRSAMQRYNIVITTGGLGPTFDDLTAACVATACDVHLKFYPEVAAHVEKRLARFNIKVNENQLRQAHLPEESVLFHNENGTAYGFGVHYGRGFVASMPGVPAEMRPMFKDLILPYLIENYKPTAVYRVDLRFINIPEPDVDEVIRKMGVPSDVRCIINVSGGEVIVRIRSNNIPVAKNMADTLRRELDGSFIGTDEESPASVLVSMMAKRNLTLSVAESCTGGLLGGEITSVSGASSVFHGGVMAYDNSVKVNQLNVPESVLESYGAVSEECAKAMADGVATLIGTDCAISVTGIAGPDGGTADKPVGTVWIGVKVKDKVLTKQFLFGGVRGDIRKRAVNSAINMIIPNLKDI
ncbi:MAG: CinA family nicotinamide mononucleotide deamidase-related protein [Deferribacteraceae bacterium]|jgi:nicotinamide-nucleotide amidase|nr:CinA family nicotinamide mononucleotide deamidase-related protein [Deferribacteraceae bacterium]